MLLERKFCQVTTFFSECGSHIHSVVHEFQANLRILQLASRLWLASGLEPDAYKPA